MEKNACFKQKIFLFQLLNTRLVTLFNFQTTQSFFIHIFRNFMCKLIFARRYHFLDKISRCQVSELAFRSISFLLSTIIFLDLEKSPHHGGLGGKKKKKKRRHRTIFTSYQLEVDRQIDRQINRSISRYLSIQKVIQTILTSYTLEVDTAFVM